MNRKLLTILIGAILMIWIAGCGPREYKPYSLADFCDQAQAGEYVRVSGMLKVPEKILSDDKTYGLLLVEDIAQPQPYLRIGVRIGDGNNRMQALPDGFTLDDIVIKADDGQLVTFGDKITVSGYFGGICGAGNADVKVDIIEIGS